MEDKNIEKEIDKQKEVNNETEQVEFIIGKSLRVGVIVSAITIIIGLLSFLITGKSGYQGSYYPTTLPEIFSGLIALKSYAIILTGLYILILTPVFRVAVSIFVFLKEKDYLYVKITVFVLAILLFSLCMGKAL